MRPRLLLAWLLGGAVLTSVAAAWVLQLPVEGVRAGETAQAQAPFHLTMSLRPLLAAIGAGTVSAWGARPGARRAGGALFPKAAPLWRKAFEGLGEPFARLAPIAQVAAAETPRVHDALYRPPPSPRMWLTRSAPPYRASEPGGFELRVAYAAGTIEHSLFQAGQAAGLPDTIILKLAEIFGWDIDFALDVRAGDTFSVIYEEKYLYGRKSADGAVLAAEFVNQGDAHRAIGFRNADGEIAYYTPEGRNVRRPFLRTPVRFSRVSSNFSASRYHPILKTWRAHRGVDYAAPAGTPVRATAGGRVAFAGWNDSYGKVVFIDHGHGYSTLYAHLSRIRPGVESGKPIAQGDVLGYVGQTGLATGPHLHYEFQVNGVHKNPLTFELPNGTTVASERRGQFQRVAAEWTRRLDLINERQLAGR